MVGLPSARAVRRNEASATLPPQDTLPAAVQQELACPRRRSHSGNPSPPQTPRPSQIARCQAFSSLKRDPFDLEMKWSGNDSRKSVRKIGCQIGTESEIGIVIYVPEATDG